MPKGSVVRKKKKPLFFIEKAQSDSELFSMLLLASDRRNLRQTLGGISTVRGSLTYWEAVATSRVGAPPTGWPQDSMMRVASHLPAIGIRAALIAKCASKKQTNLKQHGSIYCLCKSSQSGGTVAKLPSWLFFYTHGGSNLTRCIQLTSQQVRQQGPTLLRNGVIPFSDVLK